MAGLSFADFAGQVRLGYPALVVPKKVPPAYFGKVVKILKESGITAEDAYKLGKWLGRQTWLSSPLTVMVVAQKAGEWLAKAEAEMTKPSPVARAGPMKFVSEDDLDDT